MIGEHGSNVWSFAENGLQRLEVLAKHASNVWRNGETGLQGLEAGDFTGTPAGAARGEKSGGRGGEVKELP